MRLFKYKKSDLFIILFLIIIIGLISRPLEHKHYDNKAEQRALSMEKLAFNGDKSVFYGLFSFYIERKNYDKCKSLYKELVKKGYKREALDSLKNAIKTSDFAHSKTLINDITSLLVTKLQLFLVTTVSVVTHT